MTIDALKEKWDGIYAWNVKDGKFLKMKTLIKL